MRPCADHVNIIQYFLVWVVWEDRRHVEDRVFYNISRWRNVVVKEAEMFVECKARERSIINKMKIWVLAVWVV